MTNLQNIRGLHKQRGITTLVISLILLLVITFVTFYTSRSVLMEQKIATNEYRGRMAFEAAEAGVEGAAYAISQGWTRDENLVLVAANSVFDLDGDGDPDSNTRALVNGSSVTVVLTEVSDNDVSPRDGDYIATQVEATGISDDGTAQRVITQVLAIVPPVPNMPESPLLTRNAVVIGGSAQVINPEGHSTIWSGGDVDLGSNNTTSTSVADPSSANYPDCLGGGTPCSTIQSSSNEIAGVDVVEQDTNLANLSNTEFFQNFFGVTPAEFEDSRATFRGPGEDYTTFDQLDGLTGEIVWHDGNLNTAGNAQIGTAESPVLLIVDGDLDIAGTVLVNGLVFVSGNTSGIGNFTVNGAMVVQGETSTGGGSLSITYNSAILDNVSNNGAATGGAGSWRDF